MAENKPKSGWQGVVEKVLCKAIATGNIIPFGLLTIGVIIVWRLPAADLKLVILDLFNQLWFSVTGWVLFFASLIVCRRLLVWRESIHNAEIQRMAEVKNQVVQAHFELPLKTSQSPK